MIQELNDIIDHYHEVEYLMGSPSIILDTEVYNRYAKEHAELKELIEKGERYNQLEVDIEDYKLLMEDDPDCREEVEPELKELEKERDRLKERLKILMMPEDPMDKINIILEIRSGVGGEEATLFAAKIYRMYCRYAQSEGFTVEVLSKNETDLGGIKEIVIMISGYRAYNKFKFEGGIHRVQRVPVTESAGRIHTSAITVAVMPEIEPFEVKIDPKDLKIDTFRASGAGGQYVNKTESAIRITHLPTGITAECQDEKSQLKNKEKAMKIIRARVKTAIDKEKKSETDETRKNQVGSGDRSERIRTYNFPQGRVTDHRINYTSRRLKDFLDGEMAPLIEALLLDEQSKKMVKTDI